MPTQQKSKQTHPLLNVIKNTLSNIPFVNLLYISAFLIGLNLIAILAIQKLLPPEIPLFYGLPEGQEQLASSLELTIPSLISLVISIINLFFALILKDKFLKQVLIITAFVVTIFSAITTIRIALLVGAVPIL